MPCYPIDYQCNLVVATLPGHPVAEYCRVGESLTLQPGPALALGARLSGPISNINSDADRFRLQRRTESHHHLQLMLHQVILIGQSDDRPIAGVEQAGIWLQEEPRYSGYVTTNLDRVRRVVAEHAPDGGHVTCVLR
ncbi:uncharacterized protein METZ01_LOCUS8759 [marine metagenome]|uniref:Uncharacterized protein n=1 Tax=marine metagenome TaxID=408172 RepID=A0A381NMT2_9ZZZZ